jgi:hypothetical protein
MNSRCGRCLRCSVTTTVLRRTGARFITTSTTTGALVFAPADFAVVRTWIHPMALTVMLYSAARLGIVALHFPAGFT